MDFSHRRLSTRCHDPSTGSGLTVTTVDKVGRSARSGGPSRALVVAPTLLEYVVARGTIGRALVVRSGIQRTRDSKPGDAGTIVVCGLAGALSTDLKPGTIVIAQAVGTENSKPRFCSQALVESMRLGATRIGFEPKIVTMLTAKNFVTGEERDRWHSQGYDVADMETALWMSHGRQVTSVRVVLDTPDHSISEEWLRSSRAIVRPALWRQLIWLARFAPGYARMAARVVEAGLEVFEPDNVA